MKIVIATPFYPPDTEPMALYAKKLAETLGKKHDVTVVAYSRFPEKTVGVRIFSVDKRWPLAVRLVLYTITLFFVLKKSDVLYSENGASTELPSSLVSFTLHRPFFIHLGDKAVETRLSKNFFLRKIRSFAKKQAVREILETPMERPEILPFGLPSKGTKDEYDSSWNQHIKQLLENFEHAGRH
ncbi:MAG: hypothetical protein NTZ13_03370 [Candidatus Parcubacteria bacterium]|nr:hypothetical protein [Candidatus Parcubacteria bacterium]